MSEQPSQSKQAELETQQFKLKVQILDEQLKALRKPWYRKPMVLFGGIGAVAALLGLVGDNLNQRYSAARSELAALTAEKRTTELDDQVEGLETRKSELEGEKTELQNDVEGQNNEIATGKRRLREMRAEEAKTSAELSAKQRDLDALDAKLAKLTEQIKDLEAKLPEERKAELRKIEAEIRTTRVALPKADLKACALSESGLFVAVGRAGTIVISEDRGKTWRSPERVIEGDLRDVACSADGRIIVAVGTTTPTVDGRILVEAMSAAILVSRDAGQSWTLTIREGQNFLAVCSTSRDGKYLWVASESGLDHSNDSGAHWSRASFNLTQAGTSPVRVLALDRGRALVLHYAPIFAKSESATRYGVRIYRSEDLDSPSGPYYVSSLHRIRPPLTAATPTAFWMAAWDYERGVGRLLRSVDEGKTWGSLPAVGVPHIRSLWVSANEKKLAAVIGDGRWAISDNGGNSWNRQPPGSGATMTDITGTADGGLLCCVGKKGVILWSIDGGQNWDPQVYPRPGMKCAD